MRGFVRHQGDTEALQKTKKQAADTCLSRPVKKKLASREAALAGSVAPCPHSRLLVHVH